MPKNQTDEGTAIIMNYVKKHSLHSLFNSLMNEVLSERPDEPLEYLLSRIKIRIGRSSNDEDIRQLQQEIAILRKEVMYSRRVDSTRPLEEELLRVKQKCFSVESDLEKLRHLKGELYPQDTPESAAQLILTLLPKLKSQILIDRLLGDILQLRMTQQGSSECVQRAIGLFQAPHCRSSMMSGDIKSAPMRISSLTILHFNDVYHCSESKKEPVGGCARFATALKQMASPLCTPHVLFSGDAFSPSITAAVTQGGYMVPVLNGLHVEAACVGNHDLDFGLDRFEELREQCEFPWLLTNVTHRNKTLGGCERFKIFNWEGVRVGIIGIVEQDWIETCGQLPHDVEYHDMITEANTATEELKSLGVQVIIALTHMRQPNDELLALNCPDIDIILGGHDHEYSHSVVEGTHVVKSGSDFKTFSVICLSIPSVRMLEGHDSNDPISVAVRKFEITSDYERDSDMSAVVDNNEILVDDRSCKVVAKTSVSIDCRFSCVRTQEAAIGNWATDIIRWYYHFVHCDVALLQGGCLRADTVIDPGPITLSDLMSIVPMEDPIVVIAVTGDEIYSALQSGVSRYPNHDGRFPQVSGIRFCFEPTSPHRVYDLTILNRETGRYESYCSDKTYRLATSDYLARGHDGYDVFAKRERVVDREQGIILPVLLRNYLFLQNWGEVLMCASGNNSPTQSSHTEWFTREPSVASHLSVDTTIRRAGVRIMKAVGRKLSSAQPYDEGFEGLSTGVIKPVVEGRITIMDENEAASLPSESEHADGITLCELPGAHVLKKE